MNNRKYLIPMAMKIGLLFGLHTYITPDQVADRIKKN